MNLYSIDPGARKLGIAYFIGGVLVRAETLNHDEEVMARMTLAWMTDARADVVTERMHIRPNDTFHEDDLERVEKVRLGIRNRRGFKKTYNPTQWKGSVKKTVHHRRVARVLSESELAIWVTLNHDARDAVAIGLFHLGRIERGGLLPGGSKRGTIAVSSLPPPPPLESK